ncbi:KRP95, partial [Symbiodinium microadriaticum]
MQVYVEQRRVAEDGGEIHLRAKFNLVDLAGSEKWNTKLNMGDDHISELTNINLSLHTLAKCISALVKVAKGKDSHIPYRESKLTRLLQDSLGGNSRTFLIATLSPSMLNVDESISTLKFADRAKQVMSQVSVNETRPVDHEMVLKLQREVKYLRQLLKQFVDKSAASRETLTPSAHGATDAGAGDGGSGKNGYHTNMLTSLETGDEISEAEMQSALVKATAIAKESRITTLEKENESLRRQLEASRKEATVSPKLRIKTNSPQKASQAPSDSHIKAVESLVTLAEQFDTLWKQTEIMQTTLKKFFKFEIEEDVMRQL